MTNILIWLRTNWDKLPELSTDEEAVSVPHEQRCSKRMDDVHQVLEKQVLTSYMGI
jgi:hypothetical protein